MQDVLLLVLLLLNAVFCLLCSLGPSWCHVCDAACVCVCVIAGLFRGSAVGASSLGSSWWLCWWGIRFLIWS